jgi:hypothetical protein
MKDSAKDLYRKLAFLAVILVFAIILVVALLPHPERPKVLFEVAKALVQLIGVGIVAALVKMMLDDHLSQRRRREQEQDYERDRTERDNQRAQEYREKLDAFRHDKIQRIVAVTNTVRRAQILIAADGSANTYVKQMRRLLDSQLELRLIRHETNAVGETNNLAFGIQWEALRDLFENMIGYLESLQKGFTEAYESLVDLQLDADAASGEERVQLRRKIRNHVLAADGIKDLLEKSDSFESNYLRPYENALHLMIESVISDRVPAAPAQRVAPSSPTKAP